MPGLPRVAVRHPDALTPQVIALDPIHDSLDAFAPQVAAGFPRAVALPAAPAAPALPHPPLALAPRPVAVALEPSRPSHERLDDEPVAAEGLSALARSADMGLSAVAPRAASSGSESPASATSSSARAQQDAQTAAGVLRVPRWLGIAGLSMAAGALGSLCTMLLIPPPPAPASSPQAPLAALPFTVAPAAARPIVPVPARWEVTTTASISAPRATADKPSSASASALRAPADKPPSAPSSAPPGFLSLSSTFPVRVLVDGVEVGGGPRLSLPVGAHTLTLLNDELEFAETRDVQIEARKALTITVDTPRGVLHVNARPWADVWIDGRRVGETPVGNVSLPIGTHDVLLRHPQYGESRHTVIVGAKTPARLAVELQP